MDGKIWPTWTRFDFKQEIALQLISDQLSLRLKDQERKKNNVVATNTKSNHFYTETVVKNKRQCYFPDCKKITHKGCYNCGVHLCDQNYTVHCFQQGYDVLF